MVCSLKNLPIKEAESVSPRAEECSVIFSLSGKYKHVSMFAASDDWGGDLCHGSCL